MHKKIIAILLSLTMSLNANGLTSTVFWDEQIFPGNEIISTKTIIHQSLASLAAIIATVNLADFADKENRAVHRRPYYVKGLAAGAIACGITSYFLAMKTVYNLSGQQLGIGLYHRSTILILQKAYKVLTKDLEKFGLMREDAQKIASFSLLMRKTLCAKQIVRKKLQELYINTDKCDVIIEALFKKGDVLDMFEHAAINEFLLDKQNIKNIMYLYNMYIYEAEYIVEKHKKMQNNMLLSPFAPLSMYTKMEQKFPNHPVLEIFHPQNI